MVLAGGLLCGERPEKYPLPKSIFFCRHWVVMSRAILERLLRFTLTRGYEMLRAFRRAESWPALRLADVAPTGQCSRALDPRALVTMSQITNSSRASIQQIVDPPVAVFRRSHPPAPAGRLPAGSTHECLPGGSAMRVAAVGKMLLCLVSGCTKTPKTVVDSNSQAITNSIGMEFRKSWSHSVDSGSPSFVRSACA